MYFVIAWLVGFLLYGAWMIYKMSGRDIGFDTKSNMHLLAIIFLSLFWPIHLPYIISRKLRSA